MLTIFLLAYFLFTFWQERKNVREKRYRERLFDVQSTNVDEVFLIYNEEKNMLELHGQPANKSGDLRMRLASAQTRWVKIYSYPEMVGARIVRYIVSLFDRTEEMVKEQSLKDALANAQNANAAKQNFLSRMSHEIRPP